MHPTAALALCYVRSCNVRKVTFSCSSMFAELCCESQIQSLAHFVSAQVCSHDLACKSCCTELPHRQVVQDVNVGLLSPIGKA